ncbi:FAD-dependent oxidoreductase [Brevundimonas sp.]|uniref:FAD-dependent oxidoreductase n=1 Tax=Brevundimonas sp. TaxID=1871086 RepID=UPI0028A2B13E|nr:FAD-dependent oxidoreductase [Brevundimonas sp.]
MHSSSLVSSPQVDVAVIGAGAAGLATAYWLERLGLEGAVLESSDSPGGSWPAYYNSLRWFSLGVGARCRV